MEWIHRTKKGYKFDKRIFAIYFIVVLFMALVVMQRHNWDFSARPYFKCELEQCQNPFYYTPTCKAQLTAGFGLIPLYTTEDCKDTCEWCNEAYLPRGEYGEKKDSYLLNNMWFIVLGLYVVAFVVNHYIHNRGRPFDLEIYITKKKRINVDSFRRFENAEPNSDGTNTER